MGKKIHDLPSATPLLTDEIEVSQSPHNANTSKRVTLTQLKTLISEVKMVSVYINYADVQQLNSSPYLAVAAISGKMIFVENVLAEYGDGGSTPYDTNTKLRIGHIPSDGGAKAQFGLDKFLEAPYDIKVRAVPITCDDGITVGAQYVVNKPLYIFVETGDPQNGDFGINLTIFYREVAPTL
jgi:hypothetical protein